MQTIVDFFAFRTFVSLDVLRVVYALGAIGMPLLAWAMWLWLDRFALWRSMRGVSAAAVRQVVPKCWRLISIVLFVLGFLFMELMWRMMFEFIIAYLQMHSDLQLLTQRAKLH